VTGTVTVPGAASKLQANDGRSYQNYRNDYCFFFFAASGELIIRDLSPCLVHIEVDLGDHQLSFTSLTIPSLP
jgi:hypothetical protein